MRSLTYLGMLAAVALAAPLQAADTEVRVGIDQRFRAADGDETPEFRKHVVPLLGKLGCNGRACHGSFQGQGGFRLSLFGYDFEMDHEGLAGGDSPRADAQDPEQSLVILKPTLTEPHEGGKRYDLGGWEHHVLSRWIKDGAEGYDAKSAPDLVRVEVTPSEILFGSVGETSQLKAVAVWSDGSREDVTPLSRFQTNNDQVAKISPAGLVTAADPGDTHVVVFYDTGVVPIPVVRPVTENFGPKYPDAPAPTKVDQLVVDKLRKLGIVQSELSTDAEFLRRVSLDMTGSLPTAKEVEQFLADPSPDKRARKIDELLERPTYAAWWATKLCDYTGNNDQALNNVTPVRNAASQQWYDWIHRRVAENTPYDELAAGIVLATSRDPGESYEDYCEAVSALYHEEPKGSFADRQFMPHYWARRTFRQPEDRAIGFAYAFMGIRIQCAQCHKHPFDQWTQDDFKQFTGFFRGTNFGIQPQVRDEYNAMLAEMGLDGKKGNDLQRKLPEMLKEGKTIPLQEVFAVKPRRQEQRRNPKDKKEKGKPQRAAGPPPKAKVLGGEAVDLTEHEDAREPLMEWLRNKDNPYFARAFVNRVWANYFGIGIVEPADDLSLANPPSNRELLDALAEGFVESGFDMKWLHREITNSRTYQLSWKPNDTNRLDERNFSRAVPRRLPAEVAYDAVAQATVSDEKAAAMQTKLAGRAIALPGTGNRNGKQGFALTVFGRSIRESNCDCDRSMEASLLQTVFLRNDGEVATMIGDKNGWVAQVRTSFGSDEKDEPKSKRDEKRKKGEKREARKQPKPEPMGTEDVVRQAYLRTLSRYPEPQELETAREFLDQASDPISGVRDLLWALVNTKEFIVNH